MYVCARLSKSIASYHILPSHMNDNDHANCLFNMFFIFFSFPFLLLRIRSWFRYCRTFDHCSVKPLNRHMFYHLINWMIVVHQTVLFTSISASSILFTIDHVRYSLSDRVLTIPKLGSLRGVHIDYEHESYRKHHLVNVEAFLGVQYGLYHGRFEPSKERFQLHPTSQISKHTKFGPACAQHIWTNQTELTRIRTEHFAREYYPKLLKYIEHQNEEQCLYMNIYQPQIKDLKGRDSFSSIFFFFFKLFFRTLHDVVCRQCFDFT
jgi:hypothetical protein